MSETISECYPSISFSKKIILFRVGLCDRPTIYSGESTQFHREGFILSLTLEDGSIGYGEVGYFILLFFITKYYIFYICASLRSHWQINNILYMPLRVMFTYCVS